MVSTRPRAWFWSVRYLSLSDTLDGMRKGSEEVSASSHSPLTLLGLAAVGMFLLVVLGAIVVFGTRATRRRSRSLVTVAVAAAIALVWCCNVAIVGGNARSGAVGW